MIDAKARKKIIKLWEQGESKASIQRQTGVSQPTIRKVIEEAGLGKTETRSIIDDNLEGLLIEYSERLDKIEKILEASEAIKLKNNVEPQKHDIYNFILNFTRNLPLGWVNGNIWKGLAQGIAPWAYTRLLKQVMNPDIVSAIDRRIQIYDPLPGKIFNVAVNARNGKYDVDVKLLVQEF